jgi:hypothetical protein
MLAYLRLIVREAGKFGGNGWLTYDSVFRRNQEGLSTPWNVLDAFLRQVYIANQGGKVATPCKHCQEVDHVAADCVITVVLSQVTNTTKHCASHKHTRARVVKGKTPVPIHQTAAYMDIMEWGKLQVPGQVYLWSCVCQLLWQPSSISLPRKALLRCSQSREAGHPSSKRAMTGRTSCLTVV